MTAHLRLYDAAGAFVCLLPDYTDASCQEELNGEGAYGVTIPAGGLNLATARAQLDGQVAYVDGTGELFRGLLEDDADDDADPAAPLVLSGRGLLAVLERAVVYPSGGAGTTPAEHAFTTATPGTILGTLLQRAQTRGGLPGLSWTFTNTVDSNGVAWPSTISVAYDAGVTYLDVVLGLSSQGIVDVRMVGRAAGGYELLAFAPDTELGRDRPDVLLHLGESGTGLPRQRSRRDLASEVLVLGDGGVNAERTNLTTRATWGRREASYSQGNASDAGTMAVLGDAQLTALGQPLHGRTLTYDLAPTVLPDGTTRTLPRPFTDYRVGDRLRVAGVYLQAGVLEPLRVRTIACSFTSEGSTEPSLELGDVFLEASVKLARRIAGITNGTVSTPGGGTPAAGDTIAPATPTAPTLTSSAYVLADGTTLGQISASWPAVTTNSDGTAMTDLDRYEVAYNVTGQGYKGSTSQATTSWNASGLPVGATVTVYLLAVDKSGNRSGTAQASIVVAADATPPPVPSAPVVTSGLSLVRVAWDGKGSAGEAMPPDFDYVEVHASIAGAAFAPAAATLVENMRVAGQVAMTDWPYGSTVYVRLVAVDRSGNKSNPSAAGSGMPEQVDLGDLPDQLLTAAKLADGAVEAGKLAAGAVTAAAIAANAVTTAAIAADAVQAGQLAAGAVTATKLGAGAVTAAALGAGAVTAAAIGAGAVGTAAIAAGAVNTGALAAAAVDASKLAASSVTTAAIAANAVTAGTLAAGAVTAAAVGFQVGGNNVLRNSSFELGDFTGWNYGGAAVVAVGRTGTKGARLTRTGGSVPQAFSELHDVTPGDTWTASTWVLHEVAGQPTVSLNLNGDSATVPGAFDGPRVNSDTSKVGVWQRISRTDVVPAGIVKLRLRHYIDGGSDGAPVVDDAQLEQGDVATSYSRAPGELDAASITALQLATGAVTAAAIAANAVTTASLAAGAVTTAQLAAGAVTAGQIAAGAVTAGAVAFQIGGGNELLDSGLEGGTFWNFGSGFGTAGNQSTSVWKGTKGGTFTMAASGAALAIGPYATLNAAPITPGTWKAFSVYLAADAANTGANRVSVRLRFFDASGVLIATTGGTVTSAPITTVAGAFQRVVVVAQAPATAVKHQPQMYVAGADANTGDRFYYDGLQLETGDVPTAWAPKADEILPGTITATEIADNAVTTPKLVAGAVVAGKIAAGAVVAGTIAANAVTATELAAGSVTAAAIAAGSVQTASLAAGAVTTATLAAGAVTAGQLAAGAVTAGKIAANAVTATELAAGSVTAAAIAAGSIQTAALAAGAVTTSTLAAGAVTAGTIAAGAVVAGKIAAGAITATELAAGAVTANKLLVQIGGGNLLANSSFENATSYVANWNYSGGASRETGITHGGGASVKFAKTPANVEILTSVTSVYLAVGDTATLSAWLYLADANTLPHINLNGPVDWGPAYASNAKVGVWQRVVSTVTIGAGQAGNYVGRIYDDGGGTGTYYVDEVQLERGDVATAWAPKADEILPGTILANMVAAGAITTAALAAGAVTTAVLAAGAVTAATIAANTITAAQIAAGAITTATLAAGAVTTSTLAAGAVTTATIAAGAVTAGTIAAGAVSTGQLAAGAVTTAVLAAGAVTAYTIAAATISVDRLAAGVLSVGNLTAGRLVASYVELGGRLTTASGGAQSGARLELDGAGLRAYNSGGTNTVAIGADGTASFSGTVTGALFQTDASTGVDRVVIDGRAGSATKNQLTFYPTSASNPPARIYVTTDYSGSQYGQSLRLESGSGTNTGYAGNASYAYLNLAVDYGRGSDGAVLGYYRSGASMTVELRPSQGLYLRTGLMDLYTEGDYYSTMRTFHNLGHFRMDGSNSANSTPIMYVDYLYAQGTYTGTQSDPNAIRVGTGMNLIGVGAGTTDARAHLFGNAASVRVGLGASGVLYSQTATTSGYRPIYASAFTVQSALPSKRKVVPAKAGKLAALRQLEALEYEKLDEPGLRRLGVAAERVAELLPAAAARHVDDSWTEVVDLDDKGRELGIDPNRNHTGARKTVTRHMGGDATGTGEPGTLFGVDLYGLTTAVLAGLQELADKVDALEARLPAAAGAGR